MSHNHCFLIDLKAIINPFAILPNDIRLQKRRGCACVPVRLVRFDSVLLCEWDQFKVSPGATYRVVLVTTGMWASGYEFTVRSGETTDVGKVVLELQ